jgi:hypothetical protein
MIKILASDVNEIGGQPVRCRLPDPGKPLLRGDAGHPPRSGTQIGAVEDAGRDVEFAGGQDSCEHWKALFPGQFPKHSNDPGIRGSAADAEVEIFSVFPVIKCREINKAAKSVSATPDRCNPR